MIFFIIFLRAVAACLITNCHYELIYPAPQIANGGLLGDILFFAVSGFCLVNTKLPFFKWYSKRIWRIYPPVIIISLIYLILGYYKLSESHDFFWWIVYPTNYHFIASLMLLYIPFYFIMKIESFKKRIPQISILIAVVWQLFYWSAYDRSYYHIDSVDEPMIRILFFESMLLGAWFRINDSTIRNSRNILWPIGTFVSAIIYTITKIALTSAWISLNLQFINQLTLFILLFFIFRTVASYDSFLVNLSNPIKRSITLISTLTLEIYIVQSVIITQFQNSYTFPSNWIITSVAILLSAWVLHIVVKSLTLLTSKLLSKYS